MNITEASLISDCMEGDQRAIEMLVRQYEAGVFKLALSIVNDPVEASEATQETFISALKSLRAYEDRSSFKAWLYKIALNVSRSHLRKRKILERLRTTLTSVFQVETQKPSLPEDVVIQNEKEAALWRSLNKLDERHRMVVILRYFHELSIAEISEILSISEGTVHSRLHIARERLRTALSLLHGE
ncbi:MAG: RNA polymerase sigma factor [Chloroflexi bacterium]|nr:RNA polymerase sigma factor [Chloroflexota bacterium]